VTLNDFAKVNGDLPTLFISGVANFPSMLGSELVLLSVSQWQSLPLIALTVLIKEIQII